MNPGFEITAVVLVTVATLAIGTWGLRFSRTTSDFFVASRSVNPRLNASAISGEYLSGASFLGVAGLVLVSGAEMLWYPIGWTAGYLVLLTLVAAPLRRSGAYTLPDFAEARTGSTTVRTMSSILVVLIGWVYLLPQFQGAGLTLKAATGIEPWVGGLVVAAIVLLNVLAGGMRSITFVQAFQYWLKLTALLVPLFFLILVWIGDGGRSPADPSLADGAAWADPLAFAGEHPLYSTYSLMLATFLGTMGLPHVVVRFYTNPDGRAARRTTLVVLGLLGAFYVLPPVYGALGRLYAGDLVASGAADSVVLELPGRMIGGTGGELLAALITAGAVAAFLSTSSGLTIAVAGVISQDVISRRRGSRIDGVLAFRIAAAVAVVVPFVLAVVVQSVSLAAVVGLAFAFAAATFCPLLVLGIWWRGLTDVGAVAGMAIGALITGAAIIDTMIGTERSGWAAALVGQPAAVAVPASFLTMILASLATPHRQPPHVLRFMVRLHTPEAVVLDRGEGSRLHD